MPRALRVEYEGATFHVMCLGNRDVRIFSVQEDTDLWLKTLAEACERSQLIVHAYLPDEDAFPSSVGDAEWEPGGGYEMVAGDVHRLVSELTAQLSTLIVLPGLCFPGPAVRSP